MVVFAYNPGPPSLEGGWDRVSGGGVAAKRQERNGEHEQSDFSEGPSIAFGATFSMDGGG